MTNKPTVPLNVADAIELVRKDAPDGGGCRWSNEQIVHHVIQPEMYSGPTLAALRSIPFDKLMAALVNGYDVEKTAEEIAHERIRTVFDARLTKWRSCIIDTDYSMASYHAGFRDGVRFALDTLGVKVAGVSADK